jgi:hypothetical protein
VDSGGNGAPMERPSIPPVVYAPTLQDDEGRTRVRMHRMRDDRVALFVYSALDRFEAQYGEGAAWVLLTAHHLEKVYDEVPFDLLLLDRELEPHATEPTPTGAGS